MSIAPSSPCRGATLRPPAPHDFVHAEKPPHADTTQSWGQAMAPGHSRVFERNDDLLRIVRRKQFPVEFEYDVAHCGAAAEMLGDVFRKHVIFIYN